MINKENLIDNLVNKMVDAMDIDSLIDYYYENTVSYLEDLSDNELLDQADTWEIDTSEYEITE